MKIRVRKGAKVYIEEDGALSLFFVNDSDWEVEYTYFHEELHMYVIQNETYANSKYFKTYIFVEDGEELE